MDSNIYRAYSFKFDSAVFTENFKKALNNKGIDKPAEFNKKLKEAGIKQYDYETVKSYFYGRRVPPLDVFISVCKTLGLNADDIAFPGSVQNPKDDDDIRISWEVLGNIFCPYNPPLNGEAPKNLTEFFNEESYEKNVDAFAKALAKYNYLMQKYHYASVSNDEVIQITYFTEKYIIERGKEESTSFEEVKKWIRDYEGEEFLDAFYDKYTLGYYAMSCHSLLEILSGAIDKKFIKYAEQLLPYQDMRRG